MLIALAVFALFYAYRMIAPFYDRAWWAGECQFPGVAPERRAFLEQKLPELKPTWPLIALGPTGRALGGLGINWLDRHEPPDLNERLSHRIASLDRFADTREEQVLAMHLIMRDLGAHYRYAEVLRPLTTRPPHANYIYELNTVRLGFRLPFLTQGKALPNYFLQPEESRLQFYKTFVLLADLIHPVVVPSPPAGVNPCPKPISLHDRGPL